MTRSKLTKGAGKKRPPRYELPPIADPHGEKSRIERYPSRWLADLLAEGKPQGVGVSMEVFNKRAVEVYRLCYEQSQSRKAREKAVSDFAAHLPHLIFDARWLGELVRKHFHFEDLIADDEGRILSSIAKGFERASRGGRFKQRTRNLKQEAAAIYRSRVYKELVDWNRKLERQLDPDPTWIRERAIEKTSDLITQNSLRLQTVQGQVQKMLEERRLYKASVLIAATLFAVRERDLEQKHNRSLAGK